MPINPLTKSPSGINLSKILNQINRDDLAHSVSSIVQKFREKMSRLLEQNIKDQEMFKDLLVLYREQAMKRVDALSRFSDVPEKNLFDVTTHTSTVVIGISRDTLREYRKKNGHAVAIERHAMRQRQIYQ